MNPKVLKLLNDIYFVYTINVDGVKLIALMEEFGVTVNLKRLFKTILTALNIKLRSKIVYLIYL